MLASWAAASSPACASWPPSSRPCSGPPARRPAPAVQHDARVPEDRALTTAPLPDLPLRHAFEVRHESLRTPAFTDLLRHHGVALVHSDNRGRGPSYDSDRALRLRPPARPRRAVRERPRRRPAGPCCGGGTRRGWTPTSTATTSALVRAPFDAITCWRGGRGAHHVSRRVFRRTRLRDAARMGRVNAPIRAVLFDCDGVLQRPANDWARGDRPADRLRGRPALGAARHHSDAEQPILDARARSSTCSARSCGARASTWTPPP